MDAKGDTHNLQESVASPELHTALFRKNPHDVAEDEAALQSRVKDKDPFVLSQSKSADPVLLTFTSVIKKRLMMFGNKNNVFLELLVPALIMILGTSVISIDFFFRSESRIMSPSRVSTLPNAQKILMKNNIHLDNYDKNNVL
jgi:hypothetical protein